MDTPIDLVALTAGRLHLRPWEPWDADEVHAACQDPEIARWTTVPSPYTREHARAFVEEVSPRGWAAGTDTLFAVLDATTARVRASVGLTGIADGSAELGCWTEPGSRGQGYTAEAVGAVCRWGFGALGLERVLWRAEVGNRGSRALAESCGFTVEGTLRRSLRGVDHWWGSLLADDDVVDRRPFGGRWTDLRGDGLLLRQWREDDRDALVLAMRDPHAARWLPVPDPFTEQDGREALARTRARWVEGQSASLAVEVDGRLAGELVLMPSALDAGLAELGWWTAPWARGQGLTGRSVAALLPWARSLGLRRLEAGVALDNTASQRAAERAGFVREGVRAAGLRPSPRDGRRHDAVAYGLVVPTPAT